MPGPAIEKKETRGSRIEMEFAASAMRGWPYYDEDRHLVEENIGSGPFKGSTIFAIFDGHAGDDTVEFLVANFINIFTSPISDSQEKINFDDAEPEKLKRLVQERFVEVDDKLREEFTKSKNIGRSGATAVCCIVSKNRILFAHCGDSRAILFDAEGKILLDVSFYSFNSNFSSFVFVWQNRR